MKIIRKLIKYSIIIFLALAAIGYFFPDPARQQQAQQPQAQDPPQPQGQPQARAANPTGAALEFCRLMENTAIVSGCEVDGWESAIDLSIDTTGLEAIKMCQDAVEIVAGKTRDFAGRDWTLRIQSPYGTRPLASCALR